MVTIKIDKGAIASIQQQLYDRLRTAIIEARMRSGERLPSIRSLAAQLNVARGTVDLVYARLADEGYIVTRGQRGTIVSPDIQQSSLSRVKAKRSVPPRVDSANAAPLPFRFGLPALDLFPRRVWARLAARQVSRLRPTDLCSPDPSGHPALREAIVTYLALARGIACGPGQIVVTAGYQAALDLVAGWLLVPGDQVWLEDPGYGFAREGIRARALRIAPIPVDGQGLCVSYGRSRHSRARLAVVTPAHQFPLGVSMSLPRRQALLAWAAECDSWILEDDYDCEFHYSGHRPPALKSIDTADRVFYAGSFSKTLFPGLRLGYVVLPATFAASMDQACWMPHRGAPVLEQSIVAAFMAEGHFARHLRRMRTHYRARRQALADALDKRFGREVEFSLQAGGLHMLARFPGLGSDIELAGRALRHGLMPTPLSGQSIEHGAGEGLLMSFTNIPEKNAPGIVTALHRAIARERPLRHR